MKKMSLLLAIVIYLSPNAHSQITKKNWMVGGAFSYSKSNSKGDDAVNSKRRNIEVMPGFGYFFADKFSAGLKLNTRLTKDKQPEINGTYREIIQNSMGIGPFVRYYFLPTESRINIFTDASLLYTYLTTKGTGTPKNVFQSLEYDISAGPVFFLNTSIGLEFTIGYRSVNAFKLDSKGEVVQFKIGLQIHLEKD